MEELGRHSPKLFQESDFHIMPAPAANTKNLEKYPNANSRETLPKDDYYKRQSSEHEYCPIVTILPHRHIATGARVMLFS